MVHDDVAGAVADREGIFLGFGDVAEAEAQVAHDDIVGGDADVVVAGADSFAGGGLAGEGDIGIVEPELAFELDGAGDAEDDGAMGLADGIAERAGAVVVEVGDFVEGSAASAGRLGAVTFGAGEGGGGGISREIDLTKSSRFRHSPKSF